MTDRANSNSTKAPKIAAGIVAFFIFVIAVASCGGSSKKSGSDNSSNNPGVAAPEPKANIFVVRSKSFCAATGVSDVYTGDGRVEFFYTLRNTGARDGTIDLAPIRQYDDGQTNESAMDISSGNAVPAHSTIKIHTDPFTYKAHQHEVVGCSVKAGDTEVPLRVVHLNY